MKVLIVEDDMSTTLSYEMTLSKIGDFKIYSCDNWADARSIIKTNVPDFAIIDLYLDHENSLEYLQLLKNQYIPYIICTGKPEDRTLMHALGEDAEAYLVKPINKEVLEYTLRKIEKKLTESSSKNEFVLFKENRNIHRVPVTSLHYIEVDGNYVTLFLESSKKLILKKSLKKILDKIDENYFWRISRSRIVNKTQINSIQKNQVILKSGIAFDLGKTYKSQVMRQFEQDQM